ncbi:MAG: hypothetical protein N2249_00210 [Melioribacter sp.]|nr:hypothetical protein [Melioribacter sp.]
MRIEGNLATNLTERILFLKEEFEKIFNSSDGTVIAITPVSMILLGDHTHYNDGILISAALDGYSFFILRKRKDQNVNIINSNNQNRVEFSIKSIPEEKDISFKYLIGVINQFKKNNLIFNNGFDCIFYSNIPDCIGLGKYSSLEVGFANALKRSFRLKVAPNELIDILYQNQLNLIGKISNKTHYYTIINSKKNELYYHDIRAKEFKSITLKGDLEVVIFDTGEKINNSLSLCNERIEECEIGVKGLRLYIWGIKNLRDVGLDFLVKHYHMLPRRIFNRVLYNVKERERVEKAIVYLKEKKFDEFGKSILESHWSMSQDYELSSEKCDFIVEQSAKSDCVIGSKMISCSPLRSTFHILKKGSSDNFISLMKSLFKERYNEELTAYKFNFASSVKNIFTKKFENVA